MPWVEKLSEPHELRRCIRDLVALSTLPAIWKDYNPNQIADSVVAALVAMLSADFVYLLIPERRGEPLIEVLHAGAPIASESLEHIRAALRKKLPARAAFEDAGELALTGTRTLGVKVHYRFDPHASRVLVDRTQIQQVLINLMRNAVEAMAASDRRELEVKTRLLDDETIEIAVADSGPGLSPEVADHLFEPFVSTKRNGMGLGLSICRSIVEAHGGRLWANPGPDGGTIFCFTLAALPAEGEGRAH